MPNKGSVKLTISVQNGTNGFGPSRLFPPTPFYHTGITARPYLLPKTPSPALSGEESAWLKIRRDQQGVKMKSPAMQTQYEPPLGTVTDSGEQDVISANFLKWSTLFLLSYFALRLVFFALNISSFVPPDEVTHAGICRVFSRVFLLPANSPESYEFGLVTNVPWLYYWVMGKLIHLNIFGLPDLAFLRLLNIPIAFGTVFFIRRTLLLLTENRLSQLLLLVVVTNTAMFSLLSASVSYDNLTNLLAAMSIYYLLAFFKYRSGTLFAAAVLSQLAGCLTKNTFLPLTLAMALLLLIHEWRNLRHFPAALVGYLRGSGRRALLPALLILAGLALNLQLYAGNYLKYGTLAPAMAAVVSPENSMQYRIAARETIFKLYETGKISYMEALQMTGEIRHPGDKSDTFFMLMNYENLKANPAMWLGPLQYVKIWFQDMAGSILGIKGHMGMYKDPRYLIPVYLVMALALAGFMLRWRPRESGWTAPCLAAIASFYAAFMLYKVNYNAYLYYGVTGITLQGRYLFPVLGPIYLLCCHYLLRLPRNRHLQLALAVATALLFIAYDFPWFLAHATPDWFSGQHR